jgi:hypothetical protein
LSWDKYRQFWTQIAQWSLRRVENADFTTEVSVDKGEGLINVEALDEKGNYRNFLNLQAVVVSPKGERQTVRFALHDRELSHVSVDGMHLVRAGNYGISVGGGQPGTGAPVVTGSFAITGERTLPR